MANCVAILSSWLFCSNRYPQLSYPGTRLGRGCVKLTKLKEPETPAMIYDPRLYELIAACIWQVSLDQMRGQSVLLPKRFYSMRFCFLPISSLLLYLNFMEQAVTDQFQQFLSEAAFGLQRAEHIGWFAGLGALEVAQALILSPIFRMSLV